MRINFEWLHCEDVSGPTGPLEILEGRQPPGIPLAAPGRRCCVGPVDTHSQGVLDPDRWTARQGAA